MKFLILLFLVSFQLYASSTTYLVDTITKCYPAKELEKEVHNEQELRKDLQGKDLRLRLLGGYSKNEISQKNPERVQLGVNFRWEDLTDSQNRKEFQNLMGIKKEHEAKYQLENFWRIKIKDFYFWKWGKTLQNEADYLLNFVQTKLAAGDDSFASIASTSFYSDLLELNRVATEFKGRISILDKDFAHCPELSTWEENLDFEYSDIAKLNGQKSSRIEYFGEVCQAQKRIRTISLERESGLWGVALSTSLTRNRLLNDTGDGFNDIRAGFELTIPISGAKAHKVVVDACDYETKLIQDEDSVERSSAELLYPILNTLQRQFKLIKKKVTILTDAKTSSGTGSRDIVQLGLNLFSVHGSLSRGESKMNANILPSKIVEREL